MSPMDRHRAIVGANATTVEPQPRDDPDPREEVMRLINIVIRVGMRYFPELRR